MKRFLRAFYYRETDTPLMPYAFAAFAIFYAALIGIGIYKATK